MSNRGRHRKKYITKVIFGRDILHYGLTNICKLKLRYTYLNPCARYKIHLNKNNEICQIEADIENQNPDTRIHGYQEY